MGGIYEILKMNQEWLGVVLGPLAAVVTMIFGYMTVLWNEMFARIDALILQASVGPLDFSPLSFLNYIFPIDDVLTCLTAYAALRVLCAAIRIIKSFIPTISG